MRVITVTMVHISREMKTLVIVCVLVAPMVSGLIFGLFYRDEPWADPPQTYIQRPPPPEKMSLWEAAAKGLVEMNYSDPRSVKSPIGGFLVRSSAPVPIVVSEYPMILSPNPMDFSFEPKKMRMNTTQDGALTPVVVPAHGNQTYAYGAAVTGTGVPDGVTWGRGSIYSQFPPWWCTEVVQYTRFDTGAFLGGGQLVPRPLVDLIIDTDPAMDRVDSRLITLRQQRIWDHMNVTPTPVVGKRPLLIEVEPNASRGVNITLGVTNIGFKEAKRTVLAETIPPGFGYVPGSFAPAPSRSVYLYDGSVRIEWEFYMPAGEKSAREDMPSNYTTRYFSYTLVVPELPSGSRYFLPGAQVDTEGDGEFDAHSAGPLIETVRQVTIPGQIYFPEYPWWVFILMMGAGSIASFLLIRRYRNLVEALRERRKG